ncbi:hypothetical protein DMI70_23310, partial [Escherichia coli]|nr:hypothetical protein [Escherichia coli]
RLPLRSRHVRLVMVANDLPALTDPLVSDVLRALTVSPISAANARKNRDAAARRSRCNSWRLGTDEPLITGRRSGGITGAHQWSKPTARAALWQQICTYEHDFFPRERHFTSGYHIEQRAHAFPWSEKNLASNPGEALSQLSVNETAKWRRCDYASGAG